MDRIKQIYKPPYRLIGQSVYTSDDVEMLMFTFLSDKDMFDIIDALNRNRKISLNHKDLQACPLSPCIINASGNVITIKGYSHMIRVLKMTEAEADDFYDHFKTVLINLISNKTMNEEHNIYNKKMNEVFDILEGHSFVVEPDTRVVEMSIAQDAVEDALNFAEKSKIKIKPLEFEDGCAYTLVSEYEVYRDDEDHLIHVFIDGVHEGVFGSFEEAKQHCVEHYEDLIKQCLITEE